jgi:hypothetical protein
MMPVRRLAIFLCVVIVFSQPFRMLVLNIAYFAIHF